MRRWASFSSSSTCWRGRMRSRTSACRFVMLARIRATDDARAKECLELVGLGDRMDHRPMQLSGGQQQRVAIARALANRPRILLADEPTGALETKTTNEIMHLMQDLNRQGITVVVITHENEVAAVSSRQIHFRDGRIESDSAHPDLRRASGARQ